MPIYRITTSTPRGFFNSSRSLRFVEEQTFFLDFEDAPHEDIVDAVVAILPEGAEITDMTPIHIHTLDGMADSLTRPIEDVRLYPL